MKRIYIYCLLTMLLTLTTATAQNHYVHGSFGSELNINDDLNNQNCTANVAFGYFLNINTAVEGEYTHGFQKNFMKFNRIGLNLLHEYGNGIENAAPFIRYGIGYKDYDIKGYDDFNLNGIDFKFGVGVNCYLSDLVCIRLGLDLTNMIPFDSDYGSFEWKNTLLCPNIGLSFNF